jgi:hypothetical protein
VPLLATFFEGLRVVLFGLGIVLVALTLDYVVYRVVRTTELLVKVLAAMAAAILTTFAFAIGAVFILLGGLAMGCPSDAYECPL